MSRRRDWRRSKWVEVEPPPLRPARIWREVVDKRTGETRVELPLRLSRVSLMLNQLYQRPVGAGWARRMLRELQDEEEG